jgi:hypothetical protein
VIDEVLDLDAGPRIAPDGVEELLGGPAGIGG